MTFSRKLVTGLVGIGLLGLSAGLRAAQATPEAAGSAAVSAPVAAPAALGVSGTTQAAAKPAVHKHKHKTYHAAADAVPDFTLAQVSNGKPFHLRGHLGQVVLIDFWATWCGPCRMAIPHLIELQKKFGGQNFTVVGVSLDQQGPDVVRPFAQQWNLNYPVVVDTDGSLARAYGGIRAIPTTLVIDRQGRVFGDPLVGYRPFEEYEDLVRRALKAS
jgi:cytochrome c biogenesis protein CcmG/thiol:disulfide interchange protein DsbE